jgi:hypothetical protein
LFGNAFVELNVAYWGESRRGLSIEIDTIDPNRTGDDPRMPEMAGAFSSAAILRDEMVAPELSTTSCGTSAQPDPHGLMIWRQSDALQHHIVAGYSRMALA